MVVDACRVEEALHTQHVHRYLDLAQVDAEAPGDDAHVAPLVARAMRDVVLEDASVQGIQWHIIVIKLKFKSVPARCRRIQSIHRYQERDTRNAITICTCSAVAPGIEAATSSTWMNRESSPIQHER